MTPRTFRAIWGITGAEEHTEFLDDYRDGTIGGVEFETGTAIEISRGWFTNDYATFGGDYRTFATQQEPLNPLRWRATPGAEGPIYVDHDAGLEAYLADLEERVEDVVDYVVPDEEYTGVIWLDLEDWQPIWRRDFREGGSYDHAAATGIDPSPWSLEAVWRRYLAEVLLEPEVVGYSSATGSERDEMEDHFESRYIGVARPVHDMIYATVRALRPNAKVSEYGWPPAWLYHVLPSNPQRPFLLAANAKYVPRMAKNWDCLLPSFYPAHQAVLRDPPGTDYLTDTDWTNFYIHTAKEFARVKSICGGMRTYWVIGCRFHYEGALSPVTMSSTTARLQMGMARLHKADGILLWDHLSEHSPETQAQMIGGLVPMLPRIKNYLETLNGAYLEINSPIAIGPIG